MGIEGADLLELDIISKARIPAAIKTYQSAEDNVHPWATTRFARDGAVGIGPNGPGAEFGALAQLLEDAINESIKNLQDTAAAIQVILKDILSVDEAAQGRLDKARREAGEIAYS
jgi:hypothetical protein